MNGTKDFKGVMIHCPNCSNKHLFEASTRCEGMIQIKCKDCRQVVTIDLGEATRTSRHLPEYMRCFNLK